MRSTWLLVFGMWLLLGGRAEARALPILPAPPADTVQARIRRQLAAHPQPDSIHLVLLTNLADALQAHNVPSARPARVAVVALARHFSAHDLVAETLLDLADYHIDLAQYDSAATCLHASNREFTRLHDLGGQIRCLGRLARISDQQGQYAASLAYCPVIIPLALIEDQPTIRKVISTYLNSQEEFSCGLVVSSVEEMLAELAAGAPPHRLMLSDIGLPGGVTGIAGIPLIREKVPQVEVVLITVYQEPERVFQALCAGAVGYLVKTTPLLEIKQALLDVLAGGSPMSPAVARHIVRYFRPAVPQTTLTRREQQVVEGIEQGLSYKLIADRLSMSLNTVRAYIRAVYEKLQVSSKAEMMNRIRNR